MGGTERGKRNPSLRVLARIADALSVPLTELRHGDADHLDAHFPGADKARP
jgi:transcriptional regulator with XRE-family HTH domain